MENLDRELLIRIEERVKVLGEQLATLNVRLANDFVTKEHCLLKQHEHDKAQSLGRLESISKIGVLISISITLIWAVMKHV